MNSNPNAPPARTPFWTRDYFFLWQGQVVSQVGDAVYLLAVFWFVYKRSGSPLATGLVMTFSALPYLLFGGWVGDLIDRWNRKHVIVVCDLLRGVILCGVVLLAHFDVLRIWHLYASGFLISCCGAMFNPTVTSSIPRLVAKEHLLRANSLNEVSRSLSAAVSPLVGGVLIAVIGVKIAFLIDAVSFLLSGLSETFISKNALAADPDHVPRRPSLIANVKALRGLPKVLPLMTAALLTNFFGMAVILVPVFVAGATGRGGVEYGIMSACAPIGAFLGLAALTIIGAKLAKEWAMPLAVAVFGLGMLSVGLTVRLPVLLPTLVVLGLAASISRTSYVTTMQETIPSKLHPRAFGVILSADTGLQPLSYLLTGFLVQEFSLSGALIPYGIAVLICAVWIQRILFRK